MERLTVYMLIAQECSNMAMLSLKQIRKLFTEIKIFESLNKLHFEYYVFIECYVNYAALHNC